MIKNVKQIEERIEALLLEGRSKRKVWQQLKSDCDKDKLLFSLNTMSLPGARKKYQLYNLILAAILIFLTFKKLIVAFSFGTVDIYLFLSLIVPIVNVYVLREVLRFRKIGYQFLFVLSILSLVNPDNHHYQEAFLLGILIGLSAFMYMLLFPRNSEIKPE